MTSIEIVTLAAIQGITEFLPVSSSAHLAIIPQILGWPDQGLLFDIAVHVGTLLAVMLYCRKIIGAMIIALLRLVTGQGFHAEAKLALMLIVATLPLVLVGFIGFDFIETYARSLHLIGINTIIFGILLGLADIWGRRQDQKITAQSNESQLATIASADILSWRNALLIGLSQCLAMFPGVSRSGITMTTARLLGLERKHAAEFSFLLSIPTILGAALLGFLKYQADQTSHQGTDLLTVSGAEMAFAIFIAAITALAAIQFMMRLLQKFGFLPFVVYRLALGVFLLLLA